MTTGSSGTSRKVLLYGVTAFVLAGFFALRNISSWPARISYPGEEMGEQAARSLLEQLAGLSSARSTDTIIIRSELIIRESSLHRKV